MTRTRLILSYGLFAVIAVVANLASQRLSLAIYDQVGAILVALFIGTGAGLVVKFALDKVFIFQDRSYELSQQSKQFSLYTLTGVFTTAIFWGMEYAFWAIWQTHLMREVGAVIGLSIGYIIKYQLDARFVFRRSALQERT